MRAIDVILIVYAVGIPVAAFGVIQRVKVTGAILPSAGAVALACMLWPIAFILALLEKIYGDADV